ncbi:MAG: hypothetical protein KDC43_05145 [Saprospiraceae bacterium]|nr:hypothetical protein [Saprospiraceae bacterium]MCB0623307.1 hypothetical protein [Saprospiraceae bacterium]MCB0679110.1 hypothetical protein [Saprospiraceae bacterium]MCB0680784.1 hypothetical protein [Saprospiraceae bacterium]
MKNRNLFLLLVFICVLAPGIHYFVAGRQFDHTTLRNVLVGVQILGGIALLLLYGRKADRSKA